jgi:phage-related tail fiber protein
MAKLVLADLAFSGAKISGLPISAADGEPVVHQQLTSALTGLKWKASVRAATTGNVSLSAPGATMDGVTLALNDRVLVKDQTAGAENGIYVWTASGSALARAADANEAIELEQAVVSVEEGTSQNNTSWRQTAVNLTIGTTAIAWTIFGTAAGAASTTQAGSVELAESNEVTAGTSNTLAITPLALKGSALYPKKFFGNIPNAGSLVITVTHNLGNRDNHVEVIRNSDNATVLCDVDRDTDNTVRLGFAVAPANNAYRVVVIG